MTFGFAARIAVLSVSAMGLLGTGACDDEDTDAPIAVSAQWFDPAGDGVVPLAIDMPAPADVVDAAGTPIALGARTTLPPAATSIEILFDEPLDADIIEDVTFTDGDTVVSGRVGLVEVVDVPSGRRFEAVSEYLDAVRESASFVFEDVGISVRPVERVTGTSGEDTFRLLFLPSASELQVRVFAGVIADREGHVVQAAVRQEPIGHGGALVTVGEVTDALGQPIGAVAVFATKSATFTQVTAPTLADVSTTLEREDAIVVTFNTDIDVTSAHDAFSLVDTRKTPEAGDDVHIAVTAQARHSGDITTGATVGEATRVRAVLEVIPAAPLAAGRYELRVDPFYTDTFGNRTTDDPRIAPFTVQ